MTTPDIEISAETLNEFIFIEVTGNDNVTIQCNKGGCGTVFFDGEDTDTPEISWLAAAAVHVAEKHGH